MSARPKSVGNPMPPRKPLNEHKQSMTVSIEPRNRNWIRENFQDKGFRSESHMVDEAIRVLKEQSEREGKGRRSEQSH